MATTIVKFLRDYDTALTAKLTSVGGTGTPNAAGYACTNTNGLQSLSITEALVGEFYCFAYDINDDIAYQGYVVLADDTGTYRVDDTIAAIKADADLGTAGLLADTKQTRAIAEGDPVVELSAGVYKYRVYRRATNTLLIPEKEVEQPGGAALSNPATQRLAGYREEP